MSREERLAIFPTRGAVVALKLRLTSAAKGLMLLKRKSDALRIRSRKTLSDLISLKLSLVELYQEALISLAEMHFVTGEMMNAIIIENASKATTKVQSQEENYAGVRLMTLKILKDDDKNNDDYKLAGLSRGGQQLSIVKKNYFNLIKQIIEMASLQSIFVTLEDMEKLTNRRISGIENIVIPKFTNTINYLQSELEEFDREDFYRIKKIKENKSDIKNAKDISPIHQHSDIIKPNNKCMCLKKDAVN